MNLPGARVTLETVIRTPSDEASDHRRTHFEAAFAVPRGGRVRFPALALEPSSAHVGPWRELFGRLQKPNGGIKIFCKVS